MTEDSRKSFPVVAIGASAGGFEPFLELVGALPGHLGAAIVFMQHLPAGHKSYLAGLLKKKFPRHSFTEAQEGMRLNPGEIYVCSAGKRVTVEDGTFRVRDHNDVKYFRSIDDLFVSLAASFRDRLVGVVLSGAGNDGARGVGEIRAMGGSVLVQDPATAEFSSMPQSAVHQGTDMVLDIESIAREIRLITDTRAESIKIDELTSQEHLVAFLDLLSSRTNYRFHQYKKDVIQRRVRRRMQLKGIGAVTDYIEYLNQNEQECAKLAQDFMIGVTSFFRDPDAWEDLKLKVVRPIVNEDSDEPIRVWTPACSTGQESYSVTIMLYDELQRAGKKRDFQVFASDINDRAIELARKGEYAGNLDNDIPKEYHDKYFVRSSDPNIESVSEEIREHIVFARHDLLRDPPFSKQDIVICRNLLIYLEPPAQKQCIHTLHYALKNEGMLLLGKAETVEGYDNLFQQVEPVKAHLFRRVPGDSPPRKMPAGRTTPRMPEPPAPSRFQAPLRSEIVAETQQTLLEQYAPPALVVDREFEIIFNNGPTNRYLCLPQGEMTHNLLDMLPGRLRARVRTALDKMAEHPEPVSLRTTMDLHGTRRTVFLKIKPLRGRNAFFLIVFGDSKTKNAGTPVVGDLEMSPDRQSAVAVLENELDATRRDLQRHIEQYKSINEELQSSNEELQAANEELETSREELQSLNEELITVNSQLQSKITEQEETNADLVNFQTSASIPVLFLGTQLRVRRFTPAITNLVQLIPSDIGRPLGDLSHENLGPELLEDARKVLDTLEPAKRQVTSGDVSYVRSIHPYRTSDGRVDGVVVAFQDVTELARAEAQLETAAEKLKRERELLQTVFDSIPVMLSLYDPGELRFDVNRFLVETTGFSEEDFRASDIMEKIYPDPEYRRMVQEYVEACPPGFKDLRMVCHDGSVIETSWANIRMPDGRQVGIGLDIRDRKKWETELEKSEEKYRLLFTNTLNGIGFHEIITDESGVPVDYRFLDVNPMFERMTGLSRQEVVGRTVREVMPGIENDPADWIGQYGRVALQGEELHFDQFSESIGKWFGVVAFRTRPLQFCTVFDDITDRKTSELLLRESRESLARAQEVANMGSWRLDVRENRLVWSDENHRIFGIPKDTPMTYESFIAAVHPDDRTMVNETWNAALEGAPYDIEHRIVVDGKVKWIREKAFLERDEKGNVLGGIGISHDITDQKETRALLDFTEQKYVEIVKYAPAAIYEIDFRRKRFTAVNDAMCEMLGYSREELLTMDPFAILDTQGRRTFQVRLSEWLSGKELEQDVEYRVATKDGRFLHVILQVTFTKDATGKPLGATVIGHDISERKKAERERERLLSIAEEGKSILDALLEHVPEGIIITEGVGRPVTISRMVEVWTGGAMRSGMLFGSPEFVNAWGLVHLDSQTPITAEELPIMRVLKNGIAVVNDIWKQRSPDGHERYLSANAGPILDGRGTTVGCVVAWRDITAIRKSEEQLRRSEERFRTLADNISQLAWMLDETGKSFWYNKRFYEYTGATLREMQDVGWIRVIHVEHTQRVLGGLRGCLSTGEPWEDTFPMRSHEGEYRWFLSRALPIRNDQGQVVRWFGTNTDITEQRQTEEELRRRTAELTAANKELEAFSYSASHDLRAPLRTLVGFSDILEEDFPDRLGDEGKLYLDRIKNAGNKMSRLIDDMLTLSRITQKEMEKQEVDLSAMAGAFMEELRSSHPDREIDIRIQPELRAVGDPGLLDTLLKNLLRNAWKYTGKTPHPKIEFGGEVREGEMVFFVRDNGAGFDMQHVSRLFTPFQRLHSEEEFPGTGIGLAIVQRIIHRHGGSIWAESRIGEGAVFYFTM